jgi:hypothetical protein
MGTGKRKLFLLKGVWVWYREIRERWDLMASGMDKTLFFPKI